MVLLGPENLRQDSVATSSTTFNGHLDMSTSCLVSLRCPFSVPSSPQRVSTVISTCRDITRIQQVSLTRFRFTPVIPIVHYQTPKLTHPTISPFLRCRAPVAAAHLSLMTQWLVPKSWDEHLVNDKKFCRLNPKSGFLYPNERARRHGGGGARLNEGPAPP